MNATFIRTHSARLLNRAVLSAVIVTLGAATLQAQPDAPESQPAATQPAKTLSVAPGQSTIVQAPWPVKRASLTDPKVADLQVLTPRQILVSGKSVGSTDLILWSENEEAWQSRIDVYLNRQDLKNELNRIFPNTNLELRQTGDTIIVTGALRRAEQAEQLHRFLNAATATAGDAAGARPRYVDLTTIAGVQQVQLKVKVAEASRTAIRTLGINAIYAGNGFFGGSQVGPDGSGALNPTSIGPANGAVANHNTPFLFNGGGAVSPSTTLFAGVPSADVEFFVQALAENQFMRLLAEPNLVALSGEEANFLAGGEFPIPVVQGAGASTSGTSITILYKEFGVRLRFRPLVLGDGNIRLHVAPEVSELSNVGALEQEGFRVPSLLTRRAETTLELKSGQSFGMAGLINQQTMARASRIPGLGDIPVLGALFRSTRYQQGDTEMVVLVTASLVEPMSIDTTVPLPGALHSVPNDWELYGEGKIEGRAPQRISDADAQWLREHGLHRLKGPGAWSSYDTPAVPSRATVQAPSSNVRQVKQVSTGSTVNAKTPAPAKPAAAAVKPAAVATTRPSGKS